MKEPEMGKKSSTKVPITKQVWQWTESVSPDGISEDHVRTAYRLKLGKCEACRKNCMANPTCLRGLGESTWLRPGKYENYLESETNDLRNDMRKEGEFVGLRNLGATCYVNTFLQLWFHNLSFRKAVYNYREDSKEGDFPSTACGHLQLLFGMLQSSKKKNIDPTPFVKCLGLDTDQQQDAQEFSKLLLNLLDRTSEVGNFLCEEFCGEYDYCTKCKTCGNVSRQPSKFYELDISIQGKKDVNQCLGEFFKEEQLDGENQYHCASCDRKCDASRRIVIKSFPRTLNLQLLRFVFDKSSWTKKKLSSFLSFPDVLDMSRFISPDKTPQASRIYQLSAVLIHRGPSAYSGHYVAHIKDSSSKLWHRFNDEAVGQVKSGKKLDLDAVGSDDYEADLPAPAKKPKVSKNNHTSKDAYMLVYTRKDEQDLVEKREDPVIPPVVRKAVEKDNKDFTSTLETLISEVQVRVNERSKTHSELGSLLKQMLEMKVEDLVEDFYWVPTTWIKHMLSGKEEEKSSFSCEKLLCSHGKLNPDKVGSMKCIPVEIGNFFFAMCKDTPPRLKNEMLCYDCVKHKCFILRLKASLKDDHAMVTKILKGSEGVTNGYVVGRSSLRYWKSMALRKTEADSGEDLTKENEEDMPSKEAVQNQDASGRSSDEDFDFNEDLLCEHGDLTVDLKEHRVIPDSAWNIISKYFPGASAFPTPASSCRKCQDKEYDAAQSAQLEKMKIAEQKAQLSDLFYDRNRPSYEDLYGDKVEKGHTSPSFYAVSSEFVGKWREHVHNSSKNDAVSNVQNEVLLCPHRKLMHDPLFSLNKDRPFDAEGNESEPFIVLLWPREWEYISKSFVVDQTISVTRQFFEHVPKVNGDICGHDKSKNEIASSVLIKGDQKYGEQENEVTANITLLNGGVSGQQDWKIELKCHPDLCQECIEGREAERERNLRTYENRDIYVKKILPSDVTAFLKESSPESSSGSSRRSKRSRISRGEKKVTVSSTWTLKQLKIKIMQMFSTPPFDQNLYLNRQKLETDDVTLGELNIIPGSYLNLIADEPDEKSFEMLPAVPEKRTVTEEGFKGTSLLGT